jgi:hypothetical protein
MDDTEELRLERCALCQVVFWICRPCYRGQGFCGPLCKLTARTTSKRRARARHRESIEGQLDHRDRERDRRRRVRDQEVERVADHTPRFLAAVARVCRPPDPPSPMPGAVAIHGQGHDERRTDSDARHDVSGSAPTTAADLVRDTGGAICRFCSRRGLTIAGWARRGGTRHRDDRARLRRDVCAGP